MAEDIPDFPLLVPTIAPLRQEAEARGSGDFGSLWAGQAAPLGREADAATLTEDLARQALDRLASLHS
jgi:nitronate monooxygenase